MILRISSTLPYSAQLTVGDAEVDTVPGQLTIVRRQQPDEVILNVCGEIDMATAPALERELHAVESSMPRRLVLDLRALDFVDSTGIRVLIFAQRRADAGSHQLVLTRVPAHARRLFRLTGIDGRLRFE